MERFKNLVMVILVYKPSDEGYGDEPGQIRFCEPRRVIEEWEVSLVNAGVAGRILML
jgi:hypothetical protein